MHLAHKLLCILHSKWMYLFWKYHFPLKNLIEQFQINLFFNGFPPCSIQKFWNASFFWFLFCVGRRTLEELKNMKLFCSFFRLWSASAVSFVFRKSAYWKWHFYGNFEKFEHAVKCNCFFSAFYLAQYALFLNRDCFCCFLNWNALCFPFSMFACVCVEISKWKGAK